MIVNFANGLEELSVAEEDPLYMMGSEETADIENERRCCQHDRTRLEYHIDPVESQLHHDGCRFDTDDHGCDRKSRAVGA